MCIRIEKDVKDELYVEYLVIHPDGSTGIADLRIMDLDEGHHMGHILREHNIPYRSLIAETFLYPHSSTSNQRCGIGSQVLDYILLDAKARNVHAVYAQPTNITAINFLKKKVLDRVKTLTGIIFSINKESLYYLIRH